MEGGGWRVEGGGWRVRIHEARLLPADEHIDMVDDVGVIASISRREPAGLDINEHLWRGWRGFSNIDGAPRISSSHDAILDGVYTSMAMRTCLVGWNWGTGMRWKNFSNSV